ncbi:hypothetical protein BC833DRAFT_597595 [Globomyces pollinis-pini]|nr:hypothetical protein BC833DRAFT_597595 [Globomyces pollinis-pini]
MAKSKAMREKTKETCIQHCIQYSINHDQLLLGDSHVERLTWKFQHLKPKNTWLCGVGGDRISQLSWRIQNDDLLGYTQNTQITGSFTTIGIMIGTNDIQMKLMSTSQLMKLVDRVKLIKSMVENRWIESKIIIFPIPPMNCDMEMECQKNIQLFNSLLYSEGLINLCWPKLDLDLDFEDQLHLTENGYMKWFDMLRSAGFRIEFDL